MTTAEPELESLLEAYQSGNPELSEAFHDAARPILRRMASKRSYGLPKDVLDDVVQETFFSLYNPELIKFDRSKATANQYLLGRVLNAVKTTQVAHGLRRSGTDFEAEPQRQYVDLEDAEKEVESQRDIKVEAVHARHTVEKIFARFDSKVYVASMRVYGDDESQGDVAKDMNISRFALARQLMAMKTKAVQMLAAA